MADEPDMFGPGAQDEYWASDAARAKEEEKAAAEPSDSDSDTPQQPASSNFQAVDIGDNDVPVNKNDDSVAIAAAAASNWGHTPTMAQSFQAHEKDVHAIYVNRDGTVFSAGEDKSVCLWSKGIDGNFKLGVSQPTASKATALEWDQNRRWVLVGMDNGHIEIYEVNLEYTRCTLVRSIQAHSARVTSVVYDEPLDRILSSGRDKKLSIYDLINDTLQSTRCGNAWLDCMAYDRQGNRVFLGTYAQTIIVMDTSVSPPKQLHEMKGGHKGSIRSLFFEPTTRYLLSGSFDKHVCAWDIGAKGKEMLAKVTARFVGHKDKVKAVVYLPKSKRLITAGDDRAIYVWDAVTGDILSTTVAHKSKISGLVWQEHTGQLFSCSHDRTIRVWQFPAED